MFQQAALEKLEDYFTPLAQRPRRCVYFYRLAGLTPGSSAFLSRYYQAARENGVILDGRLANPGPDQLAYYTEMMGTEFRLDRGFLDQSLARWLPRMSPAQRERVTEAIFSTLNDMRGQGKNDNMLRNGYMKYMCWLYYKFERILNRLGAESLPKVLYDGALSQHELQLLVILSRAGADILALEREEGYLRLDPRSEWSRQWREEGQEPIPNSFTLKGIQEGLRRELDRQRLYGPPAALQRCTNAWMERPALDQLLIPPRDRGEGRTASATPSLPSTARRTSWPTPESCSPSTGSSPVRAAGSARSAAAFRPPPRRRSREFIGASTRPPSSWPAD